MADPTQDILAAALSLPEGERLRLASELLAGAGGARRRERGDAWDAVRARVLALLGAR